MNTTYICYGQISQHVIMNNEVAQAREHARELHENIHVIKKYLVSIECIEISKKRLELKPLRLFNVFIIIDIGITYNTPH